MSLLTIFGALLTLTTFMLLVLSIIVRLGRRQLSSRIEEMEHRLDMGAAQAREALAAYKLEVAKSYATVGLVKDSERRLTEHLVRIEVKLDAARQPN